MKKFLLAVLVAATLLAIVPAPTYADVAVGGSIPIYREKTTELKVTSKPQAVLVWCGEAFWGWDAIMGEYPFWPRKAGVTLRSYPNVDSQNKKVLGVFWANSEIDESFMDLRDSRLHSLDRDKTGRFCHDISDLDDCLGGPQAYRYYAWVQDAKRKDKTYLVLIHHASETDIHTMASEFRFMSWEWKGAKPTCVEEIIAKLIMMGAGGKPLVEYTQPKPTTESTTTTTSTSSTMPGTAGKRASIKVKIRAYRPCIVWVRDTPNGDSQPARERSWPLSKGETVMTVDVTNGDSTEIKIVGVHADYIKVSSDQEVNVR